MPSLLRRLFIGSPLATSRLAHERLGPLIGLAVFASDALSSVAYATEEILLALVLAGTAGLRFTLPVGAAISLLILIVATSYRQTIKQYPTGGGAYIVAHDNLGEGPGLVAAAALLIDYILTVTVSVTAGVAAVVSAFPQMAGLRVWLAVCVIAFIAFMNLRGVRESGFFFAVPTYLFIFSIFALLGAGLWRLATGAITPVPEAQALPPRAPNILMWFLVLRAFASGCAALTGIEAVANGVQAFKEPQARNAANVLTALAFLLLVMFIGLTWLAHSYGIVPDETHYETVVSQIARRAFGRGGMYFLIQFTTSLILFLAANTSFADFPRLASLLARDGYLPRQLANLGDRLVFNNGIILLGAAASVLVIVFHGLTHALIPLYAVGVFLAFTLSQTGMSVRWWRRREPGWRLGLVINSLGAATTCVVLWVILIVKFIHGAWIVALLLPLFVLEMKAIHRHYEGVARLLRLDRVEKVPVHPTRVILPVAGLHKGVVRALRFALGLGCPVQAVHVAVNPEAAAKLEQQWKQLQIDVPLVMLESPYRSLTAPLIEYVDRLATAEPEAFVAVVIPEFVPRHWRHNFLHNQSALLLHFAFRSRPNIVLISVRFLLGEEHTKTRPELHFAREKEEARKVAEGVERWSAQPGETRPVSAAASEETSQRDTGREPGEGQ